MSQDKVISFVGTRIPLVNAPMEVCVEAVDTTETDAVAVHERNLLVVHREVGNHRLIDNPMEVWIPFRQVVVEKIFSRVALPTMEVLLHGRPAMLVCYPISGDRAFLPVSAYSYAVRTMSSCCVT
jgi:hypothetical protein